VTIERRPVTGLKGVGPALAKRLAKLGIETVADPCSGYRHVTRTARA